MNSIITSYDWIKWAGLFDDSGFEIYKNITKTYAIIEIHNIISGFTKLMLKIYKVLDDIKT